MALPPRTPDVTQHDSARRDAVGRRREDSFDEMMSLWHGTAVRMFRGCEELRELCRRQRAMIAAQRELIRSMVSHPDFGGGVPEEDVSAAE